jgi:hypothetical protein
MAQKENNVLTDSEILKQRLTSHREYISRQWQYYAAFILLNGLLINAVKDLASTSVLLVTALGLAFITTSAVFFHLINWTQMRIHRNAIRVNQLAASLQVKGLAQDLIEIPRWHEGITPWLLFSILVFTACWLVWLYNNGLVALFLGVVLFLAIIGSSIWSTRKWIKRA